MSFNMNYLDDKILGVLNQKIKNVREDILMGEIKFEQNKIDRPDSFLKKDNFLNDDLTNNGIILKNMMNSFKIKIAYDKRRALEEKLNFIDNKVTRLKNQNNEKMSEFSPKLFSNKLIMPPLMNSKKVPKTLKMSVDFDRKQKEIDANFFIKKLNKEKVERLVREENKRKQFEIKFLQLAINVKKIILDRSIKANNNVDKNEKTETLINNEENNKLNKSNKIKNVIKVNTSEAVILPKIKSTNNSHININSRNVTTKQIKNDELAINNSNLNDNSVSFKSNKKSPYYFNDPKFSKLIKLKRQYNFKKNLNPPNYDMNYYYSDEGGPSLEEYEIL